MPILSPIQRRSPGGKALIAGMYFFLTIGAVWMVYPFLLLVSGSIKSEVDVRDFDIFPKYFTDDLALFCKFEEQRYGTLSSDFSTATCQPFLSWKMLQPPLLSSPAVLEDWHQFLADGKSWPRHFLKLGHCEGLKTIPEVTMKYRSRVFAAFPDVPKFQSDSRIRTDTVTLRVEKWQERPFQTPQGDFAPIYENLRKELPLRYFHPTSVTGYFVVQYLIPKYGRKESDLEKLNQLWETHYTNIYEVVLSPTPPLQKVQREVWWHFVQNLLSARFIQCTPSLLPSYRGFLQSQYHELSALNKIYGTSYAQWNDIFFPEHKGVIPAYTDFEFFLKTLKSPEGVSLDAPEFRWRNFLKEKYRKDLSVLNNAHGSSYTSFDQALMPIYANDWDIMKKNRAAIVWDFFTRNYRIVWDYLSGQARALQNTIIFCFLNVLTALIVNPLAAYALSRFQPRWGYKVLFVAMATMAFPAEVTQIPSFLMLREMGLLNTFAALILPIAANGYSIFLLKGFFDSLPKDLYESATLDGASELRIFTTITIPLSTPILAVIALAAFVAAYGAFMFALLVCQKESMWTLMVYIYQLQLMYNPPVVFAALVIAAIPTLLVFIFCQNIIMRGIVVPVEK